ncbi:unnamed protein product [Ectocarpus sp. 12 AP-2014]
MLNEVDGSMSNLREAGNSKLLVANNHIIRHVLCRSNAPAYCQTPSKPATRHGEERVLVHGMTTLPCDAPCVTYPTNRQTASRQTEVHYLAPFVRRLTLSSTLFHITNRTK